MSAPQIPRPPLILSHFFSSLLMEPTQVPPPDSNDGARSHNSHAAIMPPMACISNSSKTAPLILPAQLDIWDSICMQDLTKIFIRLFLVYREVSYFQWHCFQFTLALYRSDPKTIKHVFCAAGARDSCDLQTPNFFDGHNTLHYRQTWENLLPCNQCLWIIFKDFVDISSQTNS